MKNILYIFILMVAWSCSEQETDYLFEKSPEERIADIKIQYSQILTDSPHGWKTGFSSTDKLGRWMILMDFSDNGTVKIKSDPVDYWVKQGIKHDDTITYRIDFFQTPELIFESHSQFSAWNDFPYDSDGDGYIDRYAGPETQFIIDKYENGKLYMTSKTDIGAGKKQSEISHFVFEKAKAEDWNLSYVSQIKKKIAYNEVKGKYTCFKYKGEFQETIFLVDAELRMAVYYEMTPEGNNSIRELPFYITPEGFSLVQALQLPGIGEVRNFTLPSGDGYLVCPDIKDLTLEYTSGNPAVLRTPIDILNHMYLALDVYHAIGDPIGRELQDIVNNLRPPYAPGKQHLNSIYWVRNITKDMGKLPFLYPEEICLVYADTDPSYSDADLHGKNVTLVHLPVKFFSDAKRLLTVSLIGSVEEAFLKAYPNDPEYAGQKAKENMPLLSELFSSASWGIYGQNMNTNNPVLKFINESKPEKSFFTAYPYTQEDVDRSRH